jgi:quinol monooxygenase YgiN
MAYTIARVRVADFDRFIETFSTRGKDKRAEYGSRGVTVFRSAEDPNALVNVFDWDREDVEAFMADPEVGEIMAAAGLEAPPEYTFVERMAELDA